MNCDMFIWKNWYFPKNPNSPLTFSSDTNHVIRDEEHWKCCAMRRRCNRCVYHVSQHFAKRPPAVRCGSRWKWSLAGDLNWLNESLNDSWPQKERSLQLRTRLRVRSSWMGGAGEEEKEKRKDRHRCGGGVKGQREKKRRAWDYATVKSRKAVDLQSPCTHDLPWCFDA